MGNNLCKKWNREKNNLNIWVVLIHTYFYNVQITILTKQKK